MNLDQEAYAKKISSLRDYIRGIQEILNKLIRECKHLIISSDWAGAYCNICGESFGWYCEKSPTKYCEYNKDHINCDYCGEPRSRK